MNSKIFTAREIIIELWKAKAKEKTLKRSVVARGSGAVRGGWNRLSAGDFFRAGKLFCMIL